MHRSASASPASDTFFSNSTPLSHTADTVQRDQLLPTYDPLSHAAMREKSHLRSAHNAIHVIPLVLLLCAVILWFFSHPAFRR